MDTEHGRDASIKSIVRAYDSWLVRLYCRIRFHILRQRFLDEIGQYFPRSGSVLDIGCGFGLFSLYFATRFPGIKIFGIDLNPGRIKSATSAAKRLGVANIEFSVGDAAEFVCSHTIQAAYMLDLVHHIPKDAVAPLVRELTTNLAPGSRLIIKDVDSRPFHKMAFTFLLDKAMDFRASVHYWGAASLQEMLESTGLQVYRHAMVDYLPYPHMIYIATKGSTR